MGIRKSLKVVSVFGIFYIIIWRCFFLLYLYEGYVLLCKWLNIFLVILGLILGICFNWFILVVFIFCMFFKYFNNVCWCFCLILVIFFNNDCVCCFWCLLWCLVIVKWCDLLCICWIKCSVGVFELSGIVFCLLLINSVFKFGFWFVFFVIFISNGILLCG